MEKLSNLMLITPQNDRLKETEELLSRLAATEGWQNIFDSRIDKRTAPIFTRVTTINGQVIDHALFLHKGREKVVGVCQFGEDAQGPTGYGSKTEQWRVTLVLVVGRQCHCTRGV